MLSGGRPFNTRGADYASLVAQPQIRPERRTFSKSVCLLIAVFLFSLSLIPACSAAPDSDSSTTTTTKSATGLQTFDHGDFMFSYPGGWSLNTTTMPNLSRTEDGIISLNDFGKPGFWADTFAGSTYSYRSPAYIAKQLPRDGVYIEVTKAAGARGRMRPTHTGYSDIRIQTSADYQREASELQRHVRQGAARAGDYAQDIGRELTDRKWIQYSVEFKTVEAQYVFTAILADASVDTQARVAENILKSLVLAKLKDENIQSIGFKHAEEAASFFGKAIRARNFGAAYTSTSKKFREETSLTEFKASWEDWYKSHDVSPDYIWTHLSWIIDTRSKQLIRANFSLSNESVIAIIYIKQYEDGLWYVDNARQMGVDARNP